MKLDMNLKQATAFAPATVGNVAVGFDILGFALDGIGDRVTVRRSARPEVRIVEIKGAAADGVEFPLDPRKNSATAGLVQLLEDRKLDFGFDVILDKGIPLGSGMGGSAASCVAALVAANALLEEPLSREALYRFALDGESVASGSRHGDNVGPMLLGGLVLTTAERMVRIDVPEAWHCVLVHPDQVLETRRAREALAGSYALNEFVVQSANLAQVLVGCMRGDEALVRSGFADVLVEPRRAPLIPGFAQVKQAALDADAFGASISGAGPSVFAWFASRAAAEAATAPMQAAFAQAGFPSQSYVSPVAGPRAEVL